MGNFSRVFYMRVGYFLYLCDVFYEINSMYCYFITSKNGCIHPKVMCND